MSGILLEWGMF